MAINSARCFCLCLLLSGCTECFWSFLCHFLTTPPPPHPIAIVCFVYVTKHTIVFSIALIWWQLHDIYLEGGCNKLTKYKCFHENEISHARVHTHTFMTCKFNINIIVYELLLISIYRCWFDAINDACTLIVLMCPKWIAKSKKKNYVTPKYEYSELSSGVLWFLVLLLNIGSTKFMLSIMQSEHE